MPNPVPSVAPYSVYSTFSLESNRFHLHCTDCSIADLLGCSRIVPPQLPTRRAAPLGGSTRRAALLMGDRALDCACPCGHLFRGISFVYRDTTMKLSVAANWDLELLEGLAQIPEVTSVYAKLPYDLVGGGRAGSVLPSVDMDTAAAYIREAHKRGLQFSYLINAPCLGNLEQTHEGKTRLLDFVGKLVEMDVDSVSISNLALVSLVRHNYPRLSVRGSVLSWPTNLPRL